MKQINLQTDLLLCAAAGGLTGLLIQGAQFIGYGMIDAFSTVCFGFLPWVVAGTAVSLHSRCGLHASLRIFSLFASLLAGYLAGAVVLGGWVNESLMTAGVLMLVPAVLAAWVIRAGRRSVVMRFLLGAAAVAALLLDLDYHGGFTREWRLALPLLVFHFYTLSLWRRRRPRPVQYDTPQTYIY